MSTPNVALPGPGGGIGVKHKAWFVSGVAVGLAVPLGMRIYEGVLMLGHVRPVVLWLFWPTSILYASLSQQVSSATTFTILACLLILGNSLLYGLLAMALRRASIGVVLLLFVAVWILRPPSDDALRKRFAAHRVELERLVVMANSDAQLVQIGPRLVKTVDGKEYGVSEVQTVISESRWAEYLKLLESAGVKDGLYRNAVTGDVFLRAHTLNKFSPLGTYGYLYCSPVNARRSTPRSVPCVEDRESAETGIYRWKRIDSDWYIYEDFGTRAMEQQQM